MSSWSTLQYVRTGPPPEIQTTDVAELIEKLAATKFLGDASKFSCGVKFGSLPRLSSEMREGKRTYDFDGDIEWDEKVEFPSLKEMSVQLKKWDRSIEECLIDLGYVSNSIFEATQRLPCEENNNGMNLDNVFLSVGPSTSDSYECGTKFVVGWIDLSMSGNGYFFPWPFREAKGRAESHPDVLEMMEICRNTWPVASHPVAPERVSVRKEMGELWLYDDLDLPDDWHWFASEN